MRSAHGWETLSDMECWMKILHKYIQSILFIKLQSELDKIICCLNIAKKWETQSPAGWWSPDWEQAGDWVLRRMHLLNLEQLS